MLFCPVENHAPRGWTRPISPCSQLLRSQVFLAIHQRCFCCMTFCGLGKEAKECYLSSSVMDYLSRMHPRYICDIRPNTSSRAHSTLRMYLVYPPISICMHTGLGLVSKLLLFVQFGTPFYICINLSSLVHTTDL